MYSWKNAILFSENEGGVKGYLELFWKFIRFVESKLPLVESTPKSPITIYFDETQSLQIFLIL